MFFTTYMLINAYKSEIPKPKKRIIAGSLAALPTLLIVLQSIQQLSLRDVIIVLVLWLLLSWYLLRLDFA